MNTLLPGNKMGAGKMKEKIAGLKDKLAKNRTARITARKTRMEARAKSVETKNPTRAAAIRARAEKVGTRRPATNGGIVPPAMGGSPVPPVRPSRNPTPRPAGPGTVVQQASTLAGMKPRKNVLTRR